jgi:NAD(P)-dependent dehydrogenase (short-subunit alcohol dehydrogenase family)
MHAVHLITGASSGVGALLATRLAANGHTVVAVARSAGKLAALAASVEACGRIIPLAQDVADWEATAAAVMRIERDIGPIAVLVNNAAICDMRPFDAQEVATIRRILATNIDGPIAWTHAVVPFLKARRSGRIINVASVAGIHGMPLQAVYCASKHAMLGLSDALTQELLPFGIAVSAICPGGIDTPLWQHPGNPGGVPYPGDLGKIMQPLEVVEQIEFLLSRPLSSVYRRVVFFPANEWH